MKVKDILGTKAASVVTISPEASLLEASQLLAKHNIGAVVVVDGEGAAIGILSERDIVRKLSELQAGALDRRVADAMTTDLFIAVPDDDLGYVTNTMTEKRIRHLPIMDGQQLVGIVSIGDVVKAQLDDVKYEARMLRQYITSA